LAGKAVASGVIEMLLPDRLDSTTHGHASFTEPAMPKPKLSPEGEVIAAYGAAMVAAFQVLVSCLEENEAMQPRQFPEAPRVYMEMTKSREGDVNDMTLALLHEIRMATMN
jgi:hypothetical protein